MSQPKVFEFAKEIGMSPLALMDKIREWKLPVRSHMAELEPDVLNAIKSRLKEAQAPDQKGAKKKTAKKKVTKKAASDESGTAKKKVTKKTAPKTATKTATAAVSPDGAETSAKRTVVKRASAKVVIRRKTDAEENPEIAAATDTDDASAETAAASTSDDTSETLGGPETQVAWAASGVTVTERSLQAPTPQGATDERIEELAPVAAPNISQPTATMTAASSAQPMTSGAGVESAPSPAAPIPAAQPTPGRKREVVMTSQGPISGVKSEAPRRNIVGRMDLSRVQPPSNSRPSFGGGGVGPRPTGAGPGGSRGGLRTGFVAPAPVVMEDLTEARRRFDDKKRRGAPGAAGPGAGREREEEVQDFSATEFRKREMVFQPKKKKNLLAREALQTRITTPKASKRVIKVDQSMKLSELANELGVKAGQLTKVLIQNGLTATMNTVLDYDTIALIVPEFGFDAQNVHKTVDELIEATAYGDLAAAPVPRAPVVTIMGHVDHGKTSLLDAIRKANVVAGEAGGITQHIGAYQVQTEDGHVITFIDTPGHEAFTAMRARGANVTDIAVIVVAADDGVMPQTIEAVRHAKAAGVPIIVAVNKMDKAGANPDRVKQQLTEQELVPEEWGGETIYVPVSAHTKDGLPQLLEQIYLVAEVAELRANPGRSATGVVIESRVDKGRGPVATLLVQDGTLRVGQSIVAGTAAGRVRGLINDKGERVQEAGPSVPVEILGLSEVPLAGDRFDAVVDDKSAEQISAARRQRKEAEEGGQKISLEDIFSKLKQGEAKELGIILKTDVAGSSEAIKGMFDKLATDEVKIKVIHSAVGGVNESDVLLASTTKGIVVGFNVRPDAGAQAAAKRHGVDIKTYTIVYELMDDMKKAMAGLLAPEVVEKQLGRAEVRNTFNVPKVGTIAGCFVVDGKITRNSDVRLVRDGKVIYTGRLASLKRFKDDAKEVAQGYECGIGVENYNDVKVGDVIEAFTKESIVREL